jgi:hypothetical protein
MAYVVVKREVVFPNLDDDGILSGVLALGWGAGCAALAVRYASVRAARDSWQIGCVKQRQKLPKTAANSPFASLIE